MTASPGENEAWRRLYPFVSRWVEVPSGRMHYVDERPAHAIGDGPDTCLFVHGNPTWSFHWRELIAGLYPRYRCVAVDHIGCGLSEKPTRFFTLSERIDDLCALVEKLNLDRVTLVAQDWGGAIGLGAMLRLRQRLSRIVLFNTGAFPPRYIPWRIRACRGPVLGRLAVQGANAFSLAALRMTLARRHKLDAAVAAGYLTPYDSWLNRQAVYGFVRDIPTGPGDNTWHTLADIERQLPQLAAVPSCLIWGMRDWCFRHDCLDRFLAAWPGAEAHGLADVGHWVVEDAPEEALGLVKTFVERTSSPEVNSPHRTPARSNR
jgi:cis-3-alkyl-4-acyloxetan-2-one decarboxylase